MRKVLLRFVFDDLWRWQAVGNEQHVGAGWLIVVGSVAVALLLAVLYIRTRRFGESLSAAGFWMVIPVAFAVLSVGKPAIPIVSDGLPIFGYGAMMFVGVATATVTASRRVKAIGQPPEVIWDMLLWAVIPGLIGARLIYLAQNGRQVFRGATGLEVLKRSIALWDGGIVFLGAVFGGIAGIVVYCRRRRISALAMFDVLAPSLFVGEGFGRIGCFLYGCCYGRACDLPWAVRFPPDSLTFDRLLARGVITPAATSTIPLHPTQLYSSFVAFALAGVLAWYFRRRPHDGAVMALAWVIYPFGRFALEMLRDDEPGRLGTRLTFSQLMSIALLATGIAAMLWFSARTRKARVPPAG
jgi:phosphatidylglycerol:prolipoprotein diacylglycerol transferase